MYYQPSEIVNLLIAVFLAPVMWIGLRDVRVAGKRFFISGYGVMLLAFVATIIEQDDKSQLWGFFNTLEHLALGFAGVMFAIGAYAVMRDLQRGGPQ